MKGLEIMDSTQLPSVRDVFNKFEMINISTEKFNQIEEQVFDMLKNMSLEFEELNEIENLIIKHSTEAQTMGFEQGFNYAVKLLTDSLKTQ